MATEPAPRSRIGLTWPVLWIGVLALLGISVLLGRYPSPLQLGQLLDDELAQGVVLNLRLPRVLAAFLTGMMLSGAGAAFQMVFRNPLVEPGLLGVSQGAAFGAALAIVFLGGNPLLVQTSAAAFAFAGLGGSVMVARRVRFGDWVLRLLLAGIAVSALYASATGALKYLADPLRQLPDITFWLLGGLWGITWPDVLHILPVVVPALVVLWLMRWRLNLLALRDETAASLGVSAWAERAVLLAAAVAGTAAVVSKAGLVGWVGLIMPHIARRLVGADAQRALPASMLLGGIFTVICDDLARSLLPGEIPLGILTSVLGAAIFIVLLMRADVGVRR
jgi:iron complex transport system permease protein